MKVNIESLVTKMLAGGRWVVDTGDKQDFDFPILSVSTRAYGDNTAYPSILMFTDGNAHAEYITLARTEIKGADMDEVKSNTKQWLRKNLLAVLPQILANIELQEDEATLRKRGLLLTAADKANLAANEIADTFTPGFFDDRMVSDIAEIIQKYTG